MSESITDHLKAENAHLEDLNKEAHAVVSRIWSVFGNPSYDELNGKTIYDLVSNTIDQERETAAVNDQMIGIIQDRSAEIERLKAELAEVKEELTRANRDMDTYRDFGDEKSQQVAELMRDERALRAELADKDVLIAKLRAALDPFAMISREGLVEDDVYTTVTTVSDYFHAAARALSEGGENG